jgi:hypothetical protein
VLVPGLEHRRIRQTRSFQGSAGSCAGCLGEVSGSVRVQLDRKCRPRGAVRSRHSRLKPAWPAGPGRTPPIELHTPATSALPPGNLSACPGQFEGRSPEVAGSLLKKRGKKGPLEEISPQIAEVIRSAPVGGFGPKFSGGNPHARGFTVVRRGASAGGWERRRPRRRRGRGRSRRRPGT